MSVKAPPLMLGDDTSRTEPSNVSSVLKLCLNVTWAFVVLMEIFGLSRTLLVTQDGSLWKAEFGAVSLDVLTVVQLLPSVQNGPPTVQSPSPLVKAVVQPAGSAGATTPSKFSLKTTLRTPSVKVNVTVPRLDAPSCNWKVAVSVPPQLPFAVKVNGRVADPPPAANAP